MKTNLFIITIFYSLTSFAADYRFIQQARQSNDGYLLHVAAAQGDNVEIQTLLDRGVPVDELNGIGEDDALTCAARHGHTETVLLLLQKGSLKGTNGLQAAFVNRHPDVLKVLRRSNIQPNAVLLQEATELLATANDNLMIETAHAILNPIESLSN